MAVSKAVKESLKADRIDLASSTHTETHHRIPHFLGGIRE